MTLLDDLRALDVSGIVSAKGSIRATVQSPDIAAITSGGAAEIALAGLGQAMQSLRTSAPDPSSLLAPLAEALGSLERELSRFNIPIDRFDEAIAAVEQALGRILHALTENPADLGRLFGMSLSDGLRAAESVVGDIAGRSVRDVPALAGLFDAVERGVPRDATGFAHLAIDIVLPFPKEPVVRLRGRLDAIEQQLAQLQLPAGRTNGLVIALERVAVAAEAGNRVEIVAALDALATVRAHTVGQLTRELQELNAALSGLAIPNLAGELASAIPSLRPLGGSIVQQLEQWGGILAQAREHVATADLNAFVSSFEKGVDELERMARELIGGAIDAAVKAIEGFLRGLFAELGLRRLRAEVTAQLHGVATTIHDARLDRYAIEARALLEQVANTLSNAGGLQGAVQSGLGDVRQRIDDAAGALLGALENVRTTVEALSAGARVPLEKAATAVEAFGSAIDSAEVTINAISIARAADQVVSALRTLREALAKALENVPLPEPMRPPVEDLIALVEKLDVAAALEPAREAARRIAIPIEVAQEVEGALAELARISANLIPDALIAEINAEVEGALASLEGFDPTTLLPSVGTYLNDAANVVATLKAPNEVVEQVRIPYLKLLEAIDKVHPAILLAPVVEGFDAMRGRLRLPSPDLLASGVGSLLEKSGDAMTTAVSSQASALSQRSASASPAATGSARATGGAGGGTAGPAPAPQPASAASAFLEGVPRPGDVIRLFGYLPAKLVEALRALEQTEAMAALRELDRHTGGLARDLRALPEALWGMERKVDDWIAQLNRPLRQLQLRALLGVHARVADGTLEASVSLDALVASGPGRLQDDLTALRRAMRQTIRTVLEGPTSPGAALEGVATLLERLSITRLTGDLEAFLKALDPEPLAVEMDGLVSAIAARAPDLFAVVGPALQRIVERVRALIEELNPGAQMKRLIPLFDIVREELDLLDPRRLAAELGEIHGTIRGAIAAYDPALLAASLGSVADGAAAGIRALDPATLLGDVSFLSGPVDRIRQANPATALAAVGGDLKLVGERLTAIDLDALIGTINALPDRVLGEAESAIEGILGEIKALLEALRFATTSASASAEVSVG